jgi:hypothetical protein
MSNRRLNKNLPLSDPFEQSIKEIGEYIKEKYFAIKDHSHQLKVFDKYLATKIEPKINKFRK